MKLPPLSACAYRFVALVATLFIPLAVTATTLQLSAINGKSVAQFVIDGERRSVRLGLFTDEGLLLEKVADDSVAFVFNGQTQRMQVGDVVVLDSQTQGFISYQVKADQKNRYLTSALVNGGSLQAEIDRMVDGIVIPAADADRLNLPYKDKKARTLLAPKQTIIEMKDGKEVKTVIEPKDKDGKPLTYKTYFIPLNSVRVGAMDVYGLHATISEKPGLTTTVIGREFLKRVSPSWSNRVLTLVRR